MSKLGVTSNAGTITCKAVVCWGPEVDQWKVEEIRVDPPLVSEVRVKMLYASICHTDILTSKGFPLPLFPRVLGHEGVGVVESVGEGVKGLKEGDVVIPTLIGECGECENCTSTMRKTNMCLAHPVPFLGVMPDGTSRLHLRDAAGDNNGEQILYHMASCGTWSEYMVVSSSYALKVDPGIPLPHASFLSCGFSTGYGAAATQVMVEPGSSVAVLGLGAVGLGAIQGAKMRGATSIIGVDKNEMKREKGMAFGMTDFINPDRSPETPVAELIKSVTGEPGVDYCFECTGVESLLTQALESTKIGKGVAVAVGVGPNPTVSINFLSLLLGRTLKGSIFGGIKPQSELPALLDKCKNKEIDLGQLQTHEIKLEEIGSAMGMLQQLDCVKIVINIVAK